MLIFFRVLQGTTGGGLQPLSQAVLLEEFPPEERGKAMAFWAMGIIAAPVLGPTVGGWLTDTYSWRWVFYINLPIGIASLVMISLFLYDPPYIRRGNMRLDLWGLGMLAVGMGALQIMLDKGQEEDWFGSRFIIALAVTAAAGLTAFVLRQLSIDDPIVRLRLLKHRNFAAGIALVFVLGFVLYGTLVLLPLFMQTLLGWTAVTAGFWTSPRGIGTAICMPLVGSLLGRGWDGRRMLVFGFRGRQPGVFRILADGSAIGHLGHLLVSDQSGRGHGIHLRSPHRAHHGSHNSARIPDMPPASTV